LTARRGIPSGWRGSMVTSRTRPRLSTREPPDTNETLTSLPVRRKGSTVASRMPSAVGTAWLRRVSLTPSNRTRARREAGSSACTSPRRICSTAGSTSRNRMPSPQAAGSRGSGCSRATRPVMARVPPGSGISQVSGVPTSSTSGASTRMPVVLRFSACPSTTWSSVGADNRTSTGYLTRGCVRCSRDGIASAKTRPGSIHRNLGHEKPPSYSRRKAFPAVSPGPPGRTRA
jgi:hypothetical protein